ncbi:MAG: energy-coupling factor transporter transmembrane component T family protein [Anaerolineae bacterium]
MSPWGYLLFTTWAAPMAALSEGRWLLGLALVEMAFGLVCSRRGMRLLGHPRFWMLILTAVILGAFLLGEPDVGLGPLRLSREGFTAGLEMAGRAFTLALAFNLGLGSLSLSDIVAVFDRMGLRGLGFATALAMNLLGTLQEMATVTLQTIRLRGGLRRPWTALRLYLITTVANTLRYRDEIVKAATARAFDPHKNPSMPLPLQRADLWLMIVLVGYTGALLATK